MDDVAMEEDIVQVARYSIGSQLILEDDDVDRIVINDCEQEQFVY